jgi:MFS family permease
MAYTTGVRLSGAAPPLRQLVPAGTLRAKAGLPAAIATHGLLNLAFFGVDAFVPLAITNGRGQSATVAGLALTAATICWTAGSWVQAHFAARQSRRLVASVGLALIGVGIVGSAAALSPATPLMLALVAWGVAGLGMGLAFSTMSLVVLETAPAGQEGAASSALQLANTLGVALGAGLGGAIIGNAEQGGVSISGLVTHDLLMLGVTGLALFVAQRLPARQAADHVVH